MKKEQRKKNKGYSQNEYLEETVSVSNQQIQLDQMDQKAPVSSVKRFGQIMEVFHKYQVFKGLTPVKLRLVLQELGPTYVKLGQIMSSREDLISPEYCKELEKLRTHVEPMPYEVVEKIIIENFKKSPQDLFQSFNQTPLGSASIAQVHQAITKDGKNVVVKVQRPQIYEQMGVDVEMLRKAAKLIHLNKVLNSVVDVDTMIDEFWQAAQQEMDFCQEATNAKKFKDNYKDWPDIKVPFIVDDLSVSKVLVMEEVCGVTIDKKEELISLGYDPEEITYRLAENYIDQVVHSGFFHADPHSGNLMITEGQIGWIDFGMMGQLSTIEATLMNQCLKALATGDLTLLTDSVIALGIPVKEIDYTGLYTSLEQFVNRYLNSSLQKLDLADMLKEVIQICHYYGLMMPKGITMLARSLVTIEGTIKDLNPTADVFSIIKKTETIVSPEGLNQELERAAAKLTRSVRQSLDIPYLVSEVLRLAQRGQLKISLKLNDAQSILPALDRMVDRVVVCVLIAALLLSSSVICTTKLKPMVLDIPLLGLAGFFLAFCLSLWLFYKMLFNRKNKIF